MFWDSTLYLILLHQPPQGLRHQVDHGAIARNSVLFNPLALVDSYDIGLTLPQRGHLTEGAWKLGGILSVVPHSQEMAL